MAHDDCVKLFSTVEGRNRMIVWVNYLKVKNIMNSKYVSTVQLNDCTVCKKLKEYTVELNGLTSQNSISLEQT